MTDPGWLRDCGVCGRPLDRYLSPAGEETWLHFNTASQDHLAVPVRRGDVRTVYRCDFCNVDTPVPWSVPAESFTHGPSTSVGAWCACTSCAEYVARLDWRGLASRVLRGDRFGKDKADVRRYLLGLYADLQRHMTGKPYQGLPSL